MQELRVRTSQPEETEAFAEAIGARLRGGETIELISDLGGGKTTFVRGLARGMGSTDRVASPSFTISKLYASERLRLHHFDFYRLKEPGIMEHELQDIYEDPDAVIAIEWAESVTHVLPQERLIITIQSSEAGERELLCAFPESLAYLVEST